MTDPHRNRLVKLRPLSSSQKPDSGLRRNISFIHGLRGHLKATWEGQRLPESIGTGTSSGNPPGSAELRERVREGVLDLAMSARPLPFRANKQECVASQLPERHLLMPFVPNKQFVGRAAPLEKLKHILLTEKSTQRLAIYGLGGVGKTQLARAFCYDVKESNPDYSIFWISATSISRFRQDCTDIATLCGLAVDNAKEDIVMSVKRHLSSESAGNWLLVLDNADDRRILLEGEHILSKLPQSETGMILFTTRYQNVAWDLADGNVLDLAKMNPEEARLVLSKRLSAEFLGQDESLVQTLLEELAYLPLALVQASSYMAKTFITISRYLSMLQRTQDSTVKLLNHQFHDSTRDEKAENAISKTWLISFNQLKEDDPAAVNLLFFMAFLENKNIPLGILPEEDSEDDRLVSIGTLRSYSFLTEQGDDHIYDMHRLVHHAVRIWTDSQEVEAVWHGKVIRHLAQVFPSRNWEDRHLWRPWIPHALQVLKYDLGVASEERADLCLHLCVCFWRDGRFMEALKWISKCCSLREQWLPESDPALLYAQSWLAGLHENCGNIREAIHLMEKVLAIRRTTVAKHDAYLLHDQRQLGFLYNREGHYKKAVELLEEARATSAEVYAEDDRGVLSGMWYLARAYESMGQMGQAIELLEHVNFICEKLLPEEHEDRLLYRTELASVYLDAGQVKQAVSTLEYTLAICERVYDERHPHRLGSHHALACAYVENGQAEEAIEMFEKEVTIRARTLQEGHPSRLASQYRLAYAYSRNGQVEKAIEILDRVVTIQAKTLEEDHPSRLASQRGLARAYRENGQVEKAIEILERVVTIQAKTLEEDHPSRLTSQHELARAYNGNGQVEKALEIQEKVMKFRKALAEDHPDRTASEHNLALFYWDVSRFGEAISLMEHIVAMRKRSLAADHPDLLDSVREYSKMLEYRQATGS